MDISHKDHLFSILHQFCAPFSLILSISMHTFIFLCNYHPIYYVIPIMLTLFSHRFLSPKQTYLIDFSCLKPAKNLQVSVPAFLDYLNLTKRLDEERVAFMTKIITSSGIGDETYMPPPLHIIPLSPTYGDAIQESHMLFFPTLDELFAKTKVLPKEIDLLVVNCSGFCPAPSLSSIVVNRYNLRSDVKSYNISGMGCSAGIIGIDIAKNFLQRRRAKSYALVVSTEITSIGWYDGKDRRKLLLNCFFRMGCAAVLLTNQGKACTLQPKYRLVHLLRAQNAYDDDAYNSTSREEDDEGKTGFSMERYVGKAIAGLVMSHLELLGPIILPWEEKFQYVKFYHLLHEKYVPDFAKAIEYLCVPSSSQSLIKTIGKGLGLCENAFEAALATFHRYGNQSSSSMLYQMAYLEAKGIKKGDRVLQLGLGSGLKCNSLVLECVRDFESDLKANPWGDCLHHYPACVHAIMT